MKTRKSIKSKSKDLLLNLLFVFLCISGAALNITEFLKSFNQSLYKMNEAPIATITFKYKTAQRKFIDRVIWDRLKQESPVYDGDIIRTAPHSEATIWFTDGNIMNLFENTMAQVYLNESGVETKLSDGSLSVDSASAENGITLNSGNTSVKVAKGTSLNAALESSAQSESGAAFKVSVSGGSATVSGAEGSAAQELTGGNSLVVDSNGAVEIRASVDVISPQPYAKILQHSNVASQVLFTWKKQNLSEDMAVFLEVAADKNFTETAFSEVFTDKESAVVSLMPGIWFYRAGPVLQNQKIKADIKTETTEGKFQILYAPPPELMVPAQGYAYNYRTQKPAVRFIWSDNDWATSWQLEVADNVKMQNPIIKQRTSTPSSIITSLGEGQWYWRTTPYYPVNNAGLEGPSSIHSFSISKRGELLQPSLFLPERNGSVDTAESSSVSFSWQNDNEARSYTLLIANNAALNSPAVQKETADNYCVIRPSEAGITNGLWYWGVTQTDVEGNVSPVSEVRPILAAQGALYQRTIFPPDGYEVAEGRLEDVRFTWKTNVPFTMRYQVSADANFTNPVIDEDVFASAVSGKNLPQGEWYWRITADSDEINFSTSPKQFTIMPPLDQPAAVAPEVYGRAVIRPHTPYTFSWKKVEGADYYGIKVFSLNSNQEKLIFEQNFIENDSIPIDMEKLEDGQYRWTIQAFAEETLMSSRRTGVIGDYTFTMKHLRPVQLVSPANDGTINGVDAILRPGKAVWSTVEKTA